MYIYNCIYATVLYTIFVPYFLHADCMFCHITGFILYVIESFIHGIMHKGFFVHVISFYSWCVYQIF